MNIGLKIKALRQAKGMTQRDVAKALGWSHTRLTIYEKGEQPPRIENIKALAELFNVPFDYLVSENENIAEVSLTAKIPVLSWESVNTLTKPCLDIPPTTEYEAVNIEGDKELKRIFAVKVQGDSMVADGGDSFPDGSLIVIDPTREAKAGDYVIAKLKSNGKATFKLLVFDAGVWYLKPLNRAYPMLEVDPPDISVLGVIIESRTIRKYV